MFLRFQRPYRLDRLRLASAVLFAANIAGAAAFAQDPPRAAEPPAEATVTQEKSEAAKTAALELAVTAEGAAAGGRPLPVGATPSITVSLHNLAAEALGPLTLVAALDGVAPADLGDWRKDGDDLIAEITQVAPGERVERRLELRVDRAPLAASDVRVTVEARGASDLLATAEAKFPVADCVGAYRERLSVLRERMLQRVRDAADAMRRPDPQLRAGRLFPATGARTGELRDAERLAATFAANRGGDRLMAGENMRFLIGRWVSELNAFAGQTAHPALCADNRYQIAGYRQGLRPVTNRIESIAKGAAHSIAAAREAAGVDASAGIVQVVQRAIMAAGHDVDGEQDDIFTLLATARKALGRAPETKSDEGRALSLAETAVWLAETGARANALLESIEETLAVLTNAHRESCVCAY